MLIEPALFAMIALTGCVKSRLTRLFAMHAFAFGQVCGREGAETTAEPVADADDPAPKFDVPLGGNASQT